jgi:hypothetical protein
LVLSACEAGVIPVADDAALVVEGFKNLHRAIVRSIVDNDNFKLPVILV